MKSTLFWEHPLSPLEKKMATHCNILSWRIPGMEEPGGLPSMGSHGVRKDWCYLAAAAASALQHSWFKTDFSLLQVKGNLSAVPSIDLSALLAPISLNLVSTLLPSLGPLIIIFFNIKSLCYLKIFLFCLYHTAYGILVPRPGRKAVPLPWKYRVLTTGLPGKSQFGSTLTLALSTWHVVLFSFKSDSGWDLPPGPCYLFSGPSSSPPHHGLSQQSGQGWWGIRSAEVKQGQHQCQKRRTLSVDSSSKSRALSRLENFLSELYRYRAWHIVLYSEDPMVENVQLNYIVHVLLNDANPYPSFSQLNHRH